MKNRIIICFLLLAAIKSNSQDKIALRDNKFYISLHYVGNNRNHNFVSDNYNGIAGLDAKYKIYNNHIFSIQAGLGLDYFEGREIGYQLDLENSLMINPNIGIFFEVNQVFHPFLNLGYSFFSSKYKIQQSYIVYDPYDPLFNPIYSPITYNFDSFSINPGLRLFIDKNIYFQTDYKYLPIKSNINAHLISVGLGLTF
jgi:hypothetical protein